MKSLFIRNNFYSSKCINDLKQIQLALCVSFKIRLILGNEWTSRFFHLLVCGQVEFQRFPHGDSPAEVLMLFTRHKFLTSYDIYPYIFRLIDLIT